MLEHIAMDWADRLESGKYPQGTGALCEDGKFCCLGVLSEMAVEAGIAVRVESDYSMRIRYVDVVDSYGYEDEPYFDSNTGVLTNNIRVWAEMRANGGEFADGSDLDGFDALTTANDGGISFPRIAQYIRENYATL